MPKRNFQPAYSTNIVPQASAAATLNGANSVAKPNAAVGDIIISVGATTGAPTSFTVTAKIQDSADGTGFADVVGISSVVVSTASTNATIPVKWVQLRAFYRVNIVVAFVGGTSPTVGVGALTTAYDVEYSTADTTAAVATGSTVYQGQGS